MLPLERAAKMIKRRNGRQAILLFSLLIIAAPCLADFSGDELHRACTHVKNFDPNKASTDHDPLQFGVCVGYLMGIKHMNGLMMASSENNAGLFCPPEEVNNGQSARIVIHYLDDHPETLHLPAYGAVINALSDAFPCE